MNTVQVDCIDESIYPALLEMAQRYGCKSAALENTSKYQWLIDIALWTIDETITTEEAITLIKKGPPRPNVAIELTPEKVETLGDVTSSIGVYPHKSRRQHILTIKQKLINKGVTETERKDLGSDDNSIFFSNSE